MALDKEVYTQRPDGIDELSITADLSTIIITIHSFQIILISIVTANSKGLVC